MKLKSLLSIVSVLLCAVLIFSACSSGGETSADAGVVTRLADDEQEAQAASVASEDISFYEVKDGGYTIKISPIYDRDGKKVIAAYIISAISADNKAVTADKFPMLMSIVEASSNETEIKLSKGKDGKYIKIESYADAKGNLLAICDTSDSNGNGNKTEYLKLKKVTNQKGSTHYLITDEVIDIVKEKGKVYAVENGKKTEVSTVDSKNSHVKVTIEGETASTKEKEEIKKKKDTTTKKKPADKSGNKSNTDNSSDSGSSNSNSGSNTNDMGADTNDKTKEYKQIMLLKNGNAKSGADGVDISSNEVKITKAGDYLIASETGSWHGIIKLQLKNTEEAELRFEDVNISYNKGSIIQLIDSTESAERSFLEAEASVDSTADDALNRAMEDSSDTTSAPNVSLTFPTGTSSSFESSANSSTGVIYNESKLTIKGNGNIKVAATTNANNAICSSKSITVKNASVKLQTEAYGATSGIGGARGIFSYGKVNLESGSLTIHSNGDSIRCTRYNQEGGTLSAVSSACDGIDSENSITISGGKANVIAVEKSSYKVRRVNLQENNDKEVKASNGRIRRIEFVRTEKGDGFHISGGTVRGESKKVSDYDMKPSQNTLVCRTVKNQRGSTAEVKAPVKWGISSFASSENKCVKFLYSSSGVNKKNYSIKVNGKDKEDGEYEWQWNGNHGACYVTYGNPK